MSSAAYTSKNRARLKVVKNLNSAYSTKHTRFRSDRVEIYRKYSKSPYLNTARSIQRISKMLYKNLIK